MDFKDILGKLDQLNEAEMTSRKVAGKAYGGSAQADDEEDEDGEKKAAPAEKRGRGRPRKAGGEVDTSARYSGAAELQKYIVGSVPKKSKELEKLGKTKHKLSDKEPEKKKVKESLKDWIAELDMLAEANTGYTTAPSPGATVVKDKSGNVVATARTPAAAEMFKKGEVILPGSELGEAEHDHSAKAARAGKDIDEPGKQFAKIAKSAGEKYGSKERGEKVADAVLAKLRKTNEADMPPQDGLMGAGLGAGRNQGVAEGKSKKKVDEGKRLKESKEAVRGLKDTVALAVKFNYKITRSPDGQTMKFVNSDVKHTLIAKIIYDELSDESQVEYKSMDHGNVDHDIEPAEEFPETFEYLYNQALEKEYNDDRLKESKEAVRGLKDTVTFAVKNKYKVTRSPDGQTMKFVNRDIDHTLIAKIYYDESSDQSEIEYESINHGNVDHDVEPAEEFPETFEYLYNQALESEYSNDRLKESKEALIDYQSRQKREKNMKEGIDQRLKAAHHRGKAHALAKEGYNCRYDEGSEEARMYHEGYKMGLDECYGIMPMRGVVVGEEMPAATVPGMASQAMPAMEADLEEMDKTEYMRRKAKTTPGDTFKAFGQTMHDKDVLENEFAFEGWDKQLNELLTEGEEVVEEGMSISVSKGQMGAPDSVSVTASDADADKLMALIKQLGVFGAEEQASDYGATHADQDSVHQHGDLTVVDDHDGMMALIKKVAGPGMEQGSEDYADEMGSEMDHDHEETCQECGGMMEAGHSCGDKEMVDEVEDEDQMEFEVSEDNPPDSGAAETTADEDAEAEEDKALAIQSISKEELDEFLDVTVRQQGLGGAAGGGSSGVSGVSSTGGTSGATGGTSSAGASSSGNTTDQNASTKSGAAAGKGNTVSEEDEEEDSLEESFANSADDTFEADMDFMTNVISGGLNNQKSTGQTTVPVIPGQKDRMGVDGIKESAESIMDWKKLAGIK